MQPFFENFDEVILECDANVQTAIDGIWSIETQELEDRDEFAGTLSDQYYGLLDDEEL